MCRRARLRPAFSSTPLRSSNCSVAGSTYNRAELENLQAKVFPAVDDAIRRQYLANAGDLEGKDIILRKVLHQLVSGILQLDARHAPFTVRYLEETFTHAVQLASGKSFLLGGVVDRVDETGGLPRILDYKTGNVNTSAPKQPELLFTNPKKKEQFQAAFYAWLYARVSGHTSVLSGLILARQMQDGIFYLNGGEPLDASRLQEYEDRLRMLLEEIADPKIPFSQTEDADRCTYCPFKEMCGR